MEIYLPSNGRVGIQKVNLRQPKIRDLRATADFSTESSLRKTQFVKLLVDNPEDIDKITLSDRDYLFCIAVGSLSLSKINFSYTCKSCGKKVHDLIDLNEVEVLFIEEGGISLKKEVAGKEYTFRLLTVGDEIKAFDYANQVDADYDNRYEDALVASILDMSINDESIKVVRELDLAVYFSAQLFQLCIPHGINLMKRSICPYCNKPTNVSVKINGDMLNIQASTIMDRYAALVGTLDYQSFQDMTLPEYNFLVESLNAKKMTR